MTSVGPPSAAAPPLHLIIRFTTAAPDLPLTISAPATTSTLGLKQLIRAQLPASAAPATARLRLIHAGKVLSDTAALSASLNLPPPPKSHTGSHGSAMGSLGRGKGKARMMGTMQKADDTPPALRVYIHCSVSSTLSASELASEARAASAADAALSKPSPPTTSSAQPKQPTSAHTVPTPPPPTSSTTTAPAPVGFDRLLATGFTASEVASLRAQFAANLAYTHTPDTMPSGAALRALEDRWLDSSGPGGGGGSDAAPQTLDGDADAGGGGWGGMGSDEGRGGGLDDLLVGNVVGFFWPLGALVWGLREEGVWTRRRQIAVFTGVVMNLVFGFLRMTN